MKRILLLYTGGTVGCEGAPLAPMSAERFEHCLAAQVQMPLHAQCDLRALPQPLDSASMQPGDWLDIAATLLDDWTSFDGFVVLHGTDTLAFTASALSFLFAGIDKPVVVTGSQYPLTAQQSDAPRNIADAIAAACSAGLFEVAVCFAGRLFRGNRCLKHSASALDAFSSPDWPALGEVVEGIARLNTEALLPRPVTSFDSQAARAELAGMARRLGDQPVWAIHLHPGFPVDLMHAALALPVMPRGWVLACYGTGNAPHDAEFLDALRLARARGVLIVAVTQAAHGAVNLGTYLAGASLAQVGVVSGRDLTLPAALTKLQLLMARGLSPDDVALAMTRAVAGEIT